MGDLLSQETKRDPIAFFAHLREQRPLVYLADFNNVGAAWIVTGYSAPCCVACLTYNWQSNQST
jgi:hypothetical protein